jgi:hypothetical protein
LVSNLIESGDPLAEDYKVAKDAAETAARIVRESGQYPLLSSGDINIYALFVERARRLVKPEGIVALLLPSGIASDKNYAKLFQLNVKEQRLMLFLDFLTRSLMVPCFFQMCITASNSVCSPWADRSVAFQRYPMAVSSETLGSWSEQTESSIYRRSISVL